MTEMLMEKVTGPQAWNGADFENDSSWLHHLSTEDIKEIEDALDQINGKGLHYKDVTVEDFDLPTLGGKIARIVDEELENGRGFGVLSGLPLDRYSFEDTQMIYHSIIGCHLGKTLPQDIRGTKIEHITDRGLSYKKIDVRGYMTQSELTPHTDSGDLVVLLCVRPAKSGGLNYLTSGATIYNEIVEKYPEYLEPLYQGFHYNLRGNGPEGEFENITKHRVPVFCWHQGRLSVRFNQKAILTAEQLPGVPPLTQLEKDAINKVAELAMREDNVFTAMLQRGDIVLVNNWDVMHNRQAFVDYDDPNLKRRLLRLWVNIPKVRPLPWEIADHYNTGHREGTDTRDSDQAA